MTPDSSRSVVAVAHVLPADVRNHLRALADSGLLRRAFTGFTYQSSRPLERWGRGCDALLGTRLTNVLAKRPELVGVCPSDIERSVIPEALKLLLNSPRFGRRRSQSVNDWTKKYISSAAARRVRATDGLVLAREFEAQELFRQTMSTPIRRVYQLPTPHYQTVDRIIRRELESYPDPELRASHERSVAPARLERKHAELSLASRILVPSQFVKKSLLDAGIDEDRIHVLPFGTEEEWISDAVPAKNSRLFLHVGQLSFRKGTHRLLRAWKRLGAHRTCELRLVGSMRLPEPLLAEFQGIYNYVGRMPRQLLREQYAAASCFVLPALAEGFAVVILESLSCGTPIVASRNSGAEGFIDEGEQGLLHDAQDDEQLCAALERMLAHSKRREEMSANCLQRARSWTWEGYREAFVVFIRSVMARSGNGNADEAR